MSSSDAGAHRAGGDATPEDEQEATLRAEADEAAAIARDETGADADAEPEPPGRPPTEELKTAGTDEDVPASPAGGEPAPTRAPNEEPRSAGTDEDLPTGPGAAAQEGQTSPTAEAADSTPAVAPEQPPAERRPVTADPLPEAPDSVPTAAPQPEGAAEPEPQPEEPAGPVDEVREALVAVLREQLGDAVLQVDVEPGKDVWVRVPASAWVEAAQTCRDRLAMDYFCFLSAIDWMAAPTAAEQHDTDEGGGPGGAALQPVLAHGRAGGDTRLQLLARLYSTSRHLGVFLKCDVDEGEPQAPTWVGVYAGADWHERETWEMFGIEFTGHPHLVHIYLPGEFEGFPLRKDFPLLAREVKPWPGIVDVEPMPGESDEGAEGGDS